MNDTEIFPRHDFEHSMKQNNRLYILFNRLLHSTKCIQFYIFLITSSILIFLYSIFAYFFQWNEFPIIICETFLILVITGDMFIRICVTGCFKYFRKIINILDVCLILLNFFTILMYVKYHTTAQEIEDISFAFLIFVRNFSQLLRLIVLIKNQKSISKNIDEVINLNILFEEKKIEIMTKSDKYHNEVISFVNDDVSGRKNIQTTHREHHDHDFINEMGNYETENYDSKSKRNNQNNKIFL